MKNLLSFFNGFFSRSGRHIFSATLISRLLSFLASWIALQLIPNKELGAVIYAFQIISFLIPMAGFGLNQGLLRYGSQLKLIEEKTQLFVFTLKYGVLISFFLIGALIAFSFLVDFNLKNTQFYFILLTSAITTHFVFGLIKIQFRLLKNNKLFSFVELTYNLLFVFLVFTLSYYFKEFGYAISLILTPLITSLLYLNKLNIKWKQDNNRLKIIDFSFWKYGFFASLSNVTTQFLFAIDIILIGSLSNNLELVTAFKYISLFPFSLLFLSQVVITTDFVNLTEKIYQKKYILNYIKNYMKLFSIISIACLLFVYFFGEIILSVFENDYVKYKSTLIVLTFGTTGILIIRGVFGNLLSAIGKAQINFVITLIALLLNILLNYYLIPKYGILGAGITSAILMWLTGGLSALFFFYYYQNLNKY